jgi:hypothetical protein
VPDKPGDSLRKQYLQFLQAAVKQDGRRVEPKMVDLMCRVMVEKPPGPEEADVMAQITELEAKLGVTTAPGAPQPVVAAPPPPPPPQPPGVHETVLEGPPAEGIPKKATLPAHVVAAFDKAAAMQDSGTGVPAHLDPGDGSAISGTGETVGGPAAAGGVQSSDSYASMMGGAAAAPAPVAAPVAAPPPPPPPPPVAAPLAAPPAAAPAAAPLATAGGAASAALAQLQGLDAADLGQISGGEREALLAALIDALALVNADRRGLAPPECPASVAPAPAAAAVAPAPAAAPAPVAAPPPPPPPAAAAAGARRPTPSLSDAPASSIASAAAAPAAPPPVAEDVGFSDATTAAMREGAAYYVEGMETMSTDQYRKALKKKLEHTQMARLAEKGLGKTGKQASEDYLAWMEGQNNPQAQ